MLCKIKRGARQIRIFKNCFSQLHQNENIVETLKKNQSLSIPKPIDNQNDSSSSGIDWGELPFELTCDRQMQQTVLSNGTTVMTIDTLSPMLSISVMIKCGSMNETEKDSGVAHFMEHMHFKGTSKRSKYQVETEPENMGGHLNAYTTRDYTCYILNIFNEELDWGMEYISDLLTNSKYDEKLMDRERGTIDAEMYECAKEPFETVFEWSHMVAFKGHSVAKPILGYRNNIPVIKRQQIVEFRRQNFTGENLFIVTSGNVNHKKVAELAEQYFGVWPAKTPIENPELQRNLQPPQFAPRVALIQGTKESLKSGVFWNAPEFGHPDYFAFLVIARIIGEYQEQKFEYTQSGESLSEISTFLDGSEVKKFKCGYMPYINCGLFGCFIEGNTEDCAEMVTFMIAFINDFKNNLKDEDVLKERNKLFSEMMKYESGDDIAQDVGIHLMNSNRAMGRAEMAKRMSLSCNTEYLREVMEKWICGHSHSLVIWGDSKGISFNHNFYLKK